MAVIIIKEKNRTSIRLDGKAPGELLDEICEKARDQSNVEKSDLFIHCSYDDTSDETIIRLYPCSVEFEKAYLPISLDSNLREATKRKFVGACNICFDKRLYSISSKNLIDNVWMPIKKNCNKFLTMIPYAAVGGGERTRWHILCDCRTSSAESYELMTYAATRMMDMVAMNIEGNDSNEISSIPAVKYLDCVADNICNLIRDQNYS